MSRKNDPLRIIIRQAGEKIREPDGKINNDNLINIIIKDNPDLIEAYKDALIRSALIKKIGYVFSEGPILSNSDQKDFFGFMPKLYFSVSKGNRINWKDVLYDDYPSYVKNLKPKKIRITKEHELEAIYNTLIKHKIDEDKNLGDTFSRIFPHN